MLRSMFTAISSLTLHQSFLDVVADNLANANTPGFKTNRVLFQDQFAQMLNPGSAPSDEAGGINPTQIGLGVQLGYISPVFTQGMLQGTGRNLDVAVQGDGFLMYMGTNGMKYSREGSLQIDSSGYLVNSSTGLRVQGWTLATGESGPIDNNQPDDDINIPMDLTLAADTTSMLFGGNLDSQTPVPPLGSGEVNTYDTTVAVYDSLGTSHPLTIRFTRTANDTWGWAVHNTTGAAGSGTITFNADGQAAPTSIYDNAITITGTMGASNMTIDLDLRGVTMLDANNTISATYQDGLAAGAVSDVFIAPNTGEIFLLYSNGLKQLAGQIGLAKFSNPSGLIREGHSMYTSSLNSGEPNVGAPNDGSRGALVSSYLEASNVDMAQEFTNMILAQRGFQASSRVITTSDEMLLELVNLKR